MVTASDNGSVEPYGVLSGGGTFHHTQDGNMRPQNDSPDDIASFSNPYHPSPFAQLPDAYCQHTYIDQVSFSQHDAVRPPDSFHPPAPFDMIGTFLDQQQRPHDFERFHSTQNSFLEVPGNTARQENRVPDSLYQDFPCTYDPQFPHRSSSQSPPTHSQPISPREVLGNEATDVELASRRTMQHNDLHRCSTCSREFPTRKQLHRHFRDAHGPKTHCCDYPGCPKSRRGRGFTRADILKRHMKACRFRPGKLRRGKNVPSLPESSVTTPIAEAEDDEGNRGRNTHPGDISSSDDFISARLEQGTLQDLAEFLEKVSRRVNDLASSPARH